jgi:hypothetical protein
MNQKAQSPSLSHPMIFDDYKMAYSFGKQVAQWFGFGVRIKTSSHTMTQDLRTVCSSSRYVDFLINEFRCSLNFP